MSKRVINIFFLTSFITFIFLVTKYYFSEQHFIFINKSRSSYALKLDNHQRNLPLLEKNTNNIISYIDGIEKFKNKRKKRIWEELISNQNE